MPLYPEYAREIAVWWKVSLWWGFVILVAIKAVAKDWLWLGANNMFLLFIIDVRYDVSILVVVVMLTYSFFANNSMATNSETFQIKIMI